MLEKNSFEASLMLESWVEVGSKTCHFWKVEIIGHFPFLETFDLTSNSSTLIFGMMNKHDLDMNGMKKLNFSIQNPQLTFQLTALALRWPENVLMNLGPQPLGNLLQNEPIAQISSMKWSHDPYLNGNFISCTQDSLELPWPVDCLSCK
mgnify:CR=1 FL=1